jgi:hypothetical protein
VAVIVFALGHALVLLVLAATAWSAGQITAGHLLCRRGQRAPWPIILAAGLAALSQTALLLGLVGQLRASIVATLAILINVAAAGDYWRRRHAPHLHALSSSGATRITARALAGAALVMVLACPAFVLALYPPLGFDQTLYHLPFARAFAESGGVRWLPTLIYPVFPQLAELLNAAVLLLASDVATQMTGCLGLIGCVGLAFVWTREQASPAGGWLAAAMLAGSPCAVYLAATGYVEPLLALLGLSSLYAAERAHRNGDIGWIVVAGALAGTAASVKYQGLFLLPASLLLAIRRGPWRAVVRPFACYTIAASLTLVPTYARIVALTGNPLFPFFPAIFGSSPWDADEFVRPVGARRPLLAATFLWDLTFRRHAVGGLPFWSPAFAFGAPLVIAGIWQQPALRRLALVFLAYLLVAPLNSHYFLGMAPLWCVLVGSGAAGLAGSSPTARRLLVAGALIVAMGGDAYLLYRIQRLGPPPATAAGRHQLLTRQLPLHGAIDFLNRSQGRVVIYGVNAEHMVHYAAGTLLGGFNGPTSYMRVIARAQTTGSLVAAIEQTGAAYLLVPNDRSWWRQQADADPRLVRIYSDAGALLYRVGR